MTKVRCRTRPSLLPGCCPKRFRHVPSPPVQKLCHRRAVDAKININTSGPKQLTQLPGVAKNLAYSIVSHRERHASSLIGRSWPKSKVFPQMRLIKSSNGPLWPSLGRWKRDESAPAESHALHEDCEERCWLFEEDPKHQEVRQAETLRLTSATMKKGSRRWLPISDFFCRITILLRPLCTRRYSYSSIPRPRPA